VGTRHTRSYGGRQICADTDLHERALAQLLRHVAAGAHVADIGCGEGAFALRMVDAGFNVVGLDVVPAAEQATDAFEYHELDLFDAEAREGFLDRFAGSFDAVVLLEVIEHVHDPWETVGFAHRLLRPGGVLLLSTPNITSFYSRFRFLTAGRFHQFEPADLSYGHINPMTAFMVETILREQGFNLVQKSPGPRMPIVVWDPTHASFASRAFHALGWLVVAALIPVMRGGDLDGWSLFFVAQALPVKADRP
jgi:2-polyprenyl-3-methyl-5-hydroxy-6-metoxy-1,4-benzoquinol methylase